MPTRGYELYLRVLGKLTIGHAHTVIFCLILKQQNRGDFSNNFIFRKFLKISLRLFEAHTNISNIFRKFLKMSKDFRRLLNISKQTARCFDHIEINLGLNSAIIKRAKLGSTIIIMMSLISSHVKIQ